MPLKQRRIWLIAYDIRDPKRLSRLHGFIKRHAIPVQYSVFMFEGDAAKLNALIAEIQQRIDEREDDVRAYLIPERAEIHVVGRGSLAQSAYVVSEIGRQHMFLASQTEPSPAVL